MTIQSRALTFGDAAYENPLIVAQAIMSSAWPIYRDGKCPPPGRRRRIRFEYGFLALLGRFAGQATRPKLSAPSHVWQHIPQVTTK